MLSELIKRKNNQYIIVSIMLFLIGALIYQDYLLMHHVFIYTDVGKDMLLNVWPNHFHISEYLRTGNFPTWSFNVGIGQDILSGSLFRVSLVDPFVLLLMLPQPDRLVYLLPFILVLK